MAARSEHGAPSALTVLEVAEALRWTDPTLGASLAEHVRRTAGDDPAVRAAADRSVLRSLLESDRYEEVVERGVPLLAEARERGDRDDGASVLVDLAVAATELGDAGLARRLLDRLGAVDELPARIGAAACTARAEAFAATGDVPATDAAADDAAPLLLRVPQQEASVFRARVTLARGIARRRAGDVDDALAALAAAAWGDHARDVDGGRRSLTAAAEETELLAEVGRHDAARDRARGVLDPGPTGPHVARALGRIRLAALTASSGRAREATALAEELEAAGWTAGAARAWELVAGLAEADGDLGPALTALRRGHALASTARDAGDRALRALAAVADGGTPLATATTSMTGGHTAPTPAQGDGLRSGRRRRPEPSDAEPFPTTSPEPAARVVVDRADQTRRNGTAPVVATAGDEASWTPSFAAPEPAEPSAPVEAERTRPQASRDMPEGDAVGQTVETGPARSTRDELAELLASLTRSMDSSRASASAMGLEPAPEASAEPASGSDGVRQEPEPGSRSRHSAASVPTTPTTGTESGDTTASRPTFDAFSTAPLNELRAVDGNGVAPTVDSAPDDRFSPVDDVAAPDRSWTVGDLEPLPSVSSLLDPLVDPLEPPPVPSSAGAGGWTLDEEVRAGRSTPDAVDDEQPPDAGRAGIATPVSSAPAGLVADDERSRTVDPDRDAATDRGTADDRDSRPVPEVAVASSSRMPEVGPVETAPGWDTDPSAGAKAGPGDRARSSEAKPPEFGALPRERDARSVAARSVDADRVSASSSTSGTNGSTGRRRDDRSDAGADATGVSDTARRRSPSPEPRDRREPPSGTASTSGDAAGRSTDEYEEDLALTLATVLGEYHLPDVPMPPRRDRARPAPSSRPAAGSSSASEVAVPSARRHTSGSMPVPADQRWAARPEDLSTRSVDGAPRDARRDGGGANGAGSNGAGANGRGRPPESGAKLADLLAEAMDAFRHVGPESQEGSRGPGVGSRRA